MDFDNESEELSTHGRCADCSGKTCDCGDGCSGYLIEATPTTYPGWIRMRNLTICVLCAVLYRLIAEVRAGILKLNERGVTVSPELADERARNIVQSLVVNYELRELPKPAAVDWGSPQIGHGWGCDCSDCDDVRLRTKERM